LILLNAWMRQVRRFCPWERSTGDDECGRGVERGYADGERMAFADHCARFQYLPRREDSVSVDIERGFGATRQRSRATRRR
jgi:hypothetical protein